MGDGHQFYERADQSHENWAAEIAARQQLIRQGNDTAFDLEETVGRMR